MAQSKYDAIQNWLKQCPSFHGDNGNSTLAAVGYSDSWTNRMPAVDRNGEKRCDVKINVPPPNTEYPSAQDSTGEIHRIEMLADWVESQAEQEIYPLFPPNCQIHDLYVQRTVIGEMDTGVNSYELRLCIQYYYESYFDLRKELLWKN